MDYNEIAGCECNRCAEWINKHGADLYKKLHPQKENMKSDIDDIAQGIAERIWRGWPTMTNPKTQREFLIPIITTALREEFARGYEEARKETVEYVQVETKQADAEGFKGGYNEVVHDGIEDSVRCKEHSDAAYRRGVGESDKAWKQVFEDIKLQRGTGGGE